MMIKIGRQTVVEYEVSLEDITLLSVLNEIKDRKSVV